MLIFQEHFKRDPRRAEGGHLNATVRARATGQQAGQQVIFLGTEDPSVLEEVDLCRRLKSRLLLCISMSCHQLPFAAL